MKKSQKSLKDWTDQEWTTKSGKPSTQGPKATGERYLPKKAIQAMSDSEYAASSRKKREDTKKGKQFSKQPKKAAKTARRFRNKGGIMNEQSSMLVPPERQAYNKGKLVLSIVDKILGKQIRAAKTRLVDEEQAVRKLREAVTENPQGLENLTDEEYLEAVSNLPQDIKSNIGLADQPLNDTVEMIKGMEPEEVAKNLELFQSMDDMFEYAGTLDAPNARKFLNGLSEEDKIIFEG
jgi:hypothetical protein